jgi:hypothetical protein
MGYFDDFLSSLIIFKNYYCSAFDDHHEGEASQLANFSDQPTSDFAEESPHQPSTGLLVEVEWW